MVHQLPIPILFFMKGIAERNLTITTDNLKLVYKKKNRVLMKDKYKQLHCGVGFVKSSPSALSAAQNKTEEFLDIQ